MLWVDIEIQNHAYHAYNTLMILQQQWSVDSYLLLEMTYILSVIRILDILLVAIPAVITYLEFQQ